GRNLDHPRREVDSDDLPVGPNLFRQDAGQRARAAGKIDDSHPGSRRGQLEHSHPSSSLSPGHDALQAFLICLRVAAENAGKELLRFHRVRSRHSRSSVAATRIASPLVLPTTWMPTGSPSTGAGRATTGCPVVLKGRVNRASGSRTSPPAVMSGAVIEVAGSISASISLIARCAPSRRRGSIATALS